MGFESEDGVPSYLQPDKESDLEGELNFPSAPTGHAPVPAGRANVQVMSYSYKTGVTILHLTLETTKLYLLLFSTL